ncbi:MAG: 30S ribosomal protein S4 [Candidatus Tectomicrobia bacterium]|nr:30S ribosomal protein S4 [Candidatus Tectomicrobia bacterium]
MARYKESVCRLCRREGMKLFLKGDRCLGDKCSFEKRSFPPGQHGAARIRSKVSEYGQQLREKQKVRRIYGMLERPFRRYYAEASRQKGVTGDNLMRLLEVRLDNAVYRASFADSRQQARQLVAHNHVTVNGRGVNRPSYLLKKGDVIALNEKSKKIDGVQRSVGKGKARGVPSWLDVDLTDMQARVVELPGLADVQLEVKVQQIVELYSK